MIQAAPFQVILVKLTDEIRLIILDTKPPIDTKQRDNSKTISALVANKNKKNNVDNVSHANVRSLVTAVTTLQKW